MKIENSTSACLLGLALEFSRADGSFTPAKSASFLALLIECFHEVGQMEAGSRPSTPKPAANDNSCGVISGGGQK